MAKIYTQLKNEMITDSFGVDNFGTGFTVSNGIISVDQNSIANSINNRVSAGNCTGIQLSVDNDGYNHTWQYIDGDLGVIYDSNTVLTVNDRYPWSEIQTVNINGDIFIWIPKTYVNTTISNGTCTFMVSKTLKEGYHCHPCFMKNGTEIPGIYIAKYKCRGSLSSLTSTSQTSVLQACIDDIYNAVSAKGNDFRVYNIYDHHFIARLCLIEMHGIDSQVYYGGSTTAINLTVHSIEETYASLNLFIDGLRTDANSKIEIYDKNGYRSWQSTGLAVRSGYFTVPYSEFTDNYNLSDVFLYAKFLGTTESAIFNDYQGAEANCYYRTSSANMDSNGVFYLYGRVPDTTTTLLTFKMVKYGT